MIKAISIALTGLEAASKRLSTSASNIANLQTVGSLSDSDNAPYTPLDITQQTLENGGVRSDVIDRQNPFVPAFDPNSPFADEDGIIGVPNIDLATEAVSVNLTEIQYKANLKTIEAASELSEELERLFDSRA